MKDAKSENLHKALKMCGVEIHINLCAIIWRVALVVNYKGEKFSIKDVCDIAADIKMQNESSKINPPKTL